MQVATVKVALQQHATTLALLQANPTKTINVLVGPC